MALVMKRFCGQIGENDYETFPQILEIDDSQPIYKIREWEEKLGHSQLGESTTTIIFKWDKIGKEP